MSTAGPIRRKRAPQIEGPEKWTWQMAADALKNKLPNRKFRPNVAGKYRRAMTEGRWSQDVHPLVFNRESFLMDGEHRLTAQVESKTTQYWYVMRNAPDEYRATINVGQGRSASDELALRGYKNSMLLGSVARWAYKLERGEISNSRFNVANDEVLEMVSEHPDLEHSTEMGSYARNAIMRPDPTPMGAAHWWIAQTNGHAEADHFIGRFVHSQEGAGSPITALSRRLASAKIDGEALDPRIQIAAIIKTWNADVEGKYVQRFSLRTRSGEFRLEDVLLRSTPKDADVEVDLPEMPQIPDDPDVA